MILKGNYTMRQGAVQSSASPLLIQRRTVAQKVAAQIHDHPQTAVILIFGSVASGHVDAFSDVDLLVLCDPEILPVGVRKNGLLSVGVNWAFDLPCDNQLFAVIDENGLVDNIAVTIHYQTVSWVETVLQEVLTQGAITTNLLPFRPYTLLGLLQQAWIVADKAGKVAQWRVTMAHYPKQLQQNILRHFLLILREQTEELVSAAKRDLGPHAVIFHLSRAADAINSILYAINKVYDPADRRAGRTILPYLPKQPVNFSSRLSKILEGPFDKVGALERANLFEQLAQEILVLAEAG